MPLILLLVAAGLVGIGLAGIAFVMATPKPKTSGVARSLELIEANRMQQYVPVGERSAADRVWRPLLAGLLRLGRRISPTGTAERLARRLDLAGNPPGWDVERMFATKAASLIILGGLALLILMVRLSLLAVVVAAALVAMGYWLPDILLYNAGVRRQDLLRKSAPDAVDMLTICVEAGLGFDAGLAQVARNTRGPLAAEFARLLQEMQIGRSRSEAFNDLADRTTVPEIKGFVAALVQADRLGVPVATVLRGQSAEMRVRRRQRAEEQAQKVPVKIIFPVIFCVFPAFFVIVIGPGAIRIAQVFMNH